MSNIAKAIPIIFNVVFATLISAVITVNDTISVRIRHNIPIILTNLVNPFPVTITSSKH